jgi:hypothetical protein
MTPPDAPTTGQPVRLPSAPGRTIAAEGITVEDLKRRAERVRNAVVTGAEATYRETAATQGARILLISAGVVVAAIGIAYFAGSARARRLSEPWCPPRCRPVRD